MRKTTSSRWSWAATRATRATSGRSRGRAPTRRTAWRTCCTARCAPVASRSRRRSGRSLTTGRLFMAKAELGVIDGQQDIRAVEGVWLFDDDDWALIAQLQDQIMCAELLFEDPLNKEYSGCYQVRDYQYPLFRPRGRYNITPCARDVGKTESIKAQAVSH